MVRLAPHAPARLARVVRGRPRLGSVARVRQARVPVTTHSARRRPAWAPLLRQAAPVLAVIASNAATAIAIVIALTAVIAQTAVTAVTAATGGRVLACPAPVLVACVRTVAVRAGPVVPVAPECTVTVARVRAARVRAARDRAR